MHSKKCSNCGNDNDPLLTNCLFCKSSLPVIDINSMSNEQLVLNAGQWIGKLSGGFYTLNYINPHSRFGSTLVVIRKAEIQGYALQYLSLIQVRAVTNVHLYNIYNELKTQYDIGVATLTPMEKVQKDGKKMGLVILIFMLVGMILIAVIDIMKKK